MQIRDRIKGLRRVPARLLKPHPKNWRTHPEKQRDALKGVLAEIGWADAVIARELPGGGLQLIDGHLRAETAPEQKIPVLVLDVSAKEAEQLLLTLDPLAAMAEANPQTLKELLQRVSFESAAVNDALAALAAQDVSPETTAADGADERELTVDDVPAIEKKWKVQRGQLWALRGPSGQTHRLLCGDSTQADCWQQLLDGQPADLCVTSPPYNVGIDYPNYKDTLPREKFLQFLRAIAEQVHAALAPGRFVAWNIGVSPKTAPAWHVVTLEQAGFAFQRQIAWIKSGTVCFAYHATVKAKRARHYKPNWQQELIYLLSKPGDEAASQNARRLPCPVCDGHGQAERARLLPLTQGYETLQLLSKGPPQAGGSIEPGPQWASDVWHIHQGGSGNDLPTIGHRHAPRQRGKKVTRPIRVHPAVFPVGVPLAAIGLLTAAGETVIDCFGGTATTLVAAERLARRGCAIEQAPLYVAVALERLTRLGCQAELLAGGPQKKTRRRGR